MLVAQNPPDDETDHEVGEPVEVEVDAAASEMPKMS